MFFKRSLIVFLGIICIFFAFKTNAQIKTGDIVLEINPRYPKTNEEVHASVSTYSTNLNSARITWLLNGEKIIEGIGKKNFSFKVNNSDFESNLEVRIETITGSVITKKLNISPTDVDMLWEAYDTYTPPFYRGKTIAPAEGMIKVVAFPNIRNLAGFNYKWSLDDKIKSSVSGYEKNYYVYKNSYLEDKNTVGVVVSDLLGSGVGENSITIKPSSPKIIFYNKDPNIGIRWENSLSSGFYINPSGETIVAEPYFFYPKDLTSSDIEINWLLNGEKTENQKPINTLSVKLASGQSGTAKIKFIINNLNTLFESVEKQFNVSF